MVHYDLLLPMLYLPVYIRYYYNHSTLESVLLYFLRQTISTDLVYTESIAVALDTIYLSLLFKLCILITHYCNPLSLIMLMSV